MRIEDQLLRNNFPVHIREIILEKTAAAPMNSWARLMEQVPEDVDDDLLRIVNAQSSHVEVVENPNSERKRNLVINLWIGYLQQFFPLKYSGNSFFLDSTFEMNFVGFFTVKVARTRGRNGNRFMAIKTLRSLAETFLGVVCRYAHDLRHSRAGPRLIGAAGLYTKVSNLARKRKFSSTLVHVARSTDFFLHHSHHGLQPSARRGTQ